MEESAVEADLSAPDPMKTVRPRTKPAPAPRRDEKPAPAPATTTPEGDPLEGDAQTTPAAKEDVVSPKPGEDELTDAELKAAKPPEKRGPWALKKYWERRNADTEQKLAEANRKLAEHEKSGDALKRAADIEKRNGELEEEIRYHNFAKSQEFADKYQKPYEAAWAEAANELSELDVLGEDGNPVRKATPKDLLALANMPLGEARKTANQMFGDSADDVMAHRRKISEMSKSQAKALEDARKAGTDRSEKQTASAAAAQRESADLWRSISAEHAAKLDVIKPKEGDDEWNAKLAAATQLVDESFTHDPTDPSIPSEQRAQLIQKRVALRNRAIGYSTAMLEVKRLRAQLKERDDKLKAYEKTAPNGGNGATGDSATPKQAANPMDRAFQRLEAAAVPGGPRFY